MGAIAEITEGAIKGFHSIFKLKKKNISGWKRLHRNLVPRWIEKAGHKFHNKHKVKHHDLRKDFKGSHYLYGIYFRRAAHGRVKEEYYRKKRK